MALCGIILFMKKIKCFVCGKEFEINDARIGKAKFCSRRCKGKHLASLPMEKQLNWKGGRNKMQSGYIRIHTKDGWIYEHRLVAEKKLGRPLRKYEVCHHINGIKWDNQKNNIIVLTQKKHLSMETKKLWKQGKIKPHPKGFVNSGSFKKSKKYE